MTGSRTLPTGPASRSATPTASRSSSSRRPGSTESSPTAAPEHSVDPDEVGWPGVGLGGAARKPLLVVLGFGHDVDDDATFTVGVHLAPGSHVVDETFWCGEDETF